MLPYFRGDTSCVKADKKNFAIDCRESQRDVTEEDEGRLVVCLGAGGDEFGDDVDCIEGLTVGLASPLSGGEEVIC